jgi:Immunoglobulin I-set domain
VRNDQTRACLLLSVRFLYRSAWPIFEPVAVATGLTLHVGASTTVDIPFTGAPQPDVTWHFNGEPLQWHFVGIPLTWPLSGRPITWPKSAPRNDLPELLGSSETYAETRYNITTLTLNRVRHLDAGMYTVRLENPLGYATFVVEVTVIGQYNLLARCSKYSTIKKHVGRNASDATWKFKFVYRVNTKHHLMNLDFVHFSRKELILQPFVANDYELLMNLSCICDLNAMARRPNMFKTKISFSKKLLRNSST